MDYRKMTKMAELQEIERRYAKNQSILSLIEEIRAGRDVRGGLLKTAHLRGIKKRRSRDTDISTLLREIRARRDLEAKLRRALMHASLDAAQWKQKAENGRRR